MIICDDDELGEMGVNGLSAAGRFGVGKDVGNDAGNGDGNDVLLNGLNGTNCCG